MFLNGNDYIMLNTTVTYRHYILKTWRVSIKYQGSQIPEPYTGGHNEDKCLEDISNLN